MRLACSGYDQCLLDRHAGPGCRLGLSAPPLHPALTACYPRAGQQRAAPFLNVMPSLAAVAAGGRSYFDLAGPEWSVDEGLAAFGVDARGDEVYAL